MNISFYFCFSSWFIVRNKKIWSDAKTCWEKPSTSCSLSFKARRSFHWGVKLCSSEIGFLERNLKWLKHTMWVTQGRFTGRENEHVWHEFNNYFLTNPETEVFFILECGLEVDISAVLSLKFSDGVFRSTPHLGVMNNNEKSADF